MPSATLRTADTSAFTRRTPAARSRGRGGLASLPDVRGILTTPTAALSAAVLMLSACGSEEDAVDLGAALSADVTVGEPFDTTAYHPDDRGVRVDYTLTNDGEAPLLVVTERGHEQAGHPSAPALPESVWVSGRGDGVARLSKQMFDAPGDTLPTDPWTAPAVVVAPGESVSGRMFVLLPIRPDLPPTGDLLTHDEKPLDYRPDQVEVCVQVAPLPDGVPDPQDMTMATQGRALSCAGPTPVPTDD